MENQENQKKSFIAKYAPKVGILLVSTALTMVIYQVGLHAERVMDRELAKIVGYSHPENIVGASYIEDVNYDGIKDIVLVLKDGSRLEYISKGYELKAE